MVVGSSRNEARLIADKPAGGALDFVPFVSQFWSTLGGYHLLEFTAKYRSGIRVAQPFVLFHKGCGTHPPRRAAPPAARRQGAGRFAKLPGLGAGGKSLEGGHA